MKIARIVAKVILGAALVLTLLASATIIGLHAFGKYVKVDVRDAR